MTQYHRVPQGVLQLLKCTERNAAIAESRSCEVFVGEVDMMKNPVLTDM